jgi:hypothetical protein
MFANGIKNAPNEMQSSKNDGFGIGMPPIFK